MADKKVAASSDVNGTMSSVFALWATKFSDGSLFGKAQLVADGAAILTPHVSAAGWSNGDAVFNLFGELDSQSAAAARMSSSSQGDSKKIDAGDGKEGSSVSSSAQKEGVPSKPEGSSEGNSTAQGLSAKDIESGVLECLKLLPTPCQVQSVESELVSRLESELKAMGHPHTLSQAQVVKTINHNLNKLRRFTAGTQSLPEPARLCLESAYPAIIARFPDVLQLREMRTILLSVPLFCPSAAARTLGESRTDMTQYLKHRVSATLSEHVTITDDMTPEQGFSAIQLALHGGLGRKKRRKAKWLLRDAGRIQARLAPFIARSTIRQTLDGEDYRETEGDAIYVQMLKTALDNIKSVISVKNNSTGEPICVVVIACPSFVVSLFIIFVIYACSSRLDEALSASVPQGSLFGRSVECAR